MPVVKSRANLPSAKSNTEVKKDWARMVFWLWGCLGTPGAAGMGSDFYAA